MTEHSITVIDRIYDCSEGLGVEFTTASGERVRIEARNQKISVGWEVQGTLGTIATNKLISMTRTANRIELRYNPGTYIAGGSREIRHHGLHYITRRQLSRADQFLIDHPEGSVMSEKIQSEPATRELSVTTPNFETAAELIHDLGAEALSSHLPELATQWRALFGQSYLTSLE